MKLLTAVVLGGLGFGTAAVAATERPCPYGPHCVNNPYGASSPFSGNGIANPYRSPPTFLNKRPIQPAPAPQQAAPEAAGDVAARPAPSDADDEPPKGNYVPTGEIPYWPPEPQPENAPAPPRD